MTVNVNGDQRRLSGTAPVPVPSLTQIASQAAAVEETALKLVAAVLGGESKLSRDLVERLEELRTPAPDRRS